MSSPDPKLPLSIRELLALRQFIDENEPGQHWSAAENKALERVAEKVQRLATGHQVTPVRVDVTTLDFDARDLDLLFSACVWLHKKLSELVMSANDAMLMSAISALSDDQEALSILRARIETAKRELWRQTNQEGQ